MPEPVTVTGVGVGIKYILFTYIVPILSITAGATAHVIEEIRMDGWKGWLSALSTGFVAFFSGTIVLSFAYHFYPDYAGGIAGLGGFFGAKSINVLVKVLKLSIKEL
jgi:hypothetical protein